MPSIVDLTSQLVDSVRSSVPQKTATEKTASVVTKPATLPIVEALKLAADTLRGEEISEASLADVKLAFEKAAQFAQPGTGAQAPNAGGGVGAAQPMPTLPALQTTNLGVTAGAGGAPATLKAASAFATPLGTELRKLAACLRDEDALQQKKVAGDAESILKAATSLRYLQRGIGQ